MHKEQSSMQVERANNQSLKYGNIIIEQMDEKKPDGNTKVNNGTRNPKLEKLRPN